MSLQDLYNKYGKDRTTSKEVKRMVHENILTILIECDDINVIKVRGWTPVFNDGDACRHTQLVMVENYGDADFLDDENVPYDASVIDDEDEYIDMDNPITQMMIRNDFKFEATPSIWNDQYDKLVEDNINRFGNKAIAYMAISGMERLISMAYDTNFDITFVLDVDTGTLVIHENDYECGF